MVKSSRSANRWMVPCPSVMVSIVVSSIRLGLLTRSVTCNRALCSISVMDLANRVDYEVEGVATLTDRRAELPQSSCSLLVAADVEDRRALTLLERPQNLRRNRRCVQVLAYN
jgi:hypothetical protein